MFVVVEGQPIIPQYNDHWKDPNRTNIIWLGLLFSILGITMLSYHQYGEPPEYQGMSESLFHLYRTRTAQCLLSGDIAKCLPYTVETLRFNATAELNRRDDSRRGLWIMTGVIVRTAINMGYHRDPGANPDLTVLQAEYRRRIWLTVISMDDMASFFLGFPRMRSTIYSDTNEPRNVHDWELSDDSDTATLPPSRPFSEVTETTYLIVKGRLLCALGRISDFNSSNPTPGSYGTVLEIDRAVNDAYRDFPEHMKVPPLNDTALPIRTVAGFSNLSLLCMYHTGMCTLHRRFLVRGQGDNEFKFSRDRCVSSALGILDFQRVVEPSFYRMSQTRHILVLAAMILFLEIEVRRKDPPESDASPDTGTLLHMLEESCTLWAQAMGACDETWKVHRFLVGMLSNLNVDTTSGSGTTTSSHTGSTTVPMDLASTGSDVQGDSPWKEFSFEKELSDVDFDWVRFCFFPLLFSMWCFLLTCTRLHGMLSSRRPTTELIPCIEVATVDWSHTVWLIKIAVDGVLKTMVLHVKLVRDGQDDPAMYSLSFGIEQRCEALEWYTIKHEKGSYFFSSRHSGRRRDG